MLSTHLSYKHFEFNVLETKLFIFFTFSLSQPLHCFFHLSQWTCQHLVTKSRIREATSSRLPYPFNWSSGPTDPALKYLVYLYTSCSLNIFTWHYNEHPKLNMSKALLISAFPKPVPAADYFFKHLY